MSGNTIRWKTDSEGIDWNELADLLHTSFSTHTVPLKAAAGDPAAAPGVRADEAGEEDQHSGEKKEGGRQFTAEHVKITFGNSNVVVYGYDGDKLIACGRALWDGAEQGAIYNIAVDPAYQGHELGREVIQRLLDQMKGGSVILYTHPQTVKFYENLGWHRMKTGFVIHPGSEDPEKALASVNAGFTLPSGYRYPEDESDRYGIPEEK